MGKSFDRWNALCEQLKVDDGLPTWEEAGAWTQDKLYFWMRYIDITTAAMTGNPSFPGGLVYVDLFGGAGVCTLKETRRRFPGSALLAASASKPFSKIIVCEQNRELAMACQARLSQRASGRFSLHQGDCNDLIDRILLEIPPRSLTLAFIDPKGLDIKFDTIRKLSTVRADLVVLFADAYDIMRNYDAYYRENPGSKLDEVLGPGVDWRPRIDALATRTPQNERQLFAEIYKEQLRNRLAYTEFADRVMTFANGPMRRKMPLYRLIYASKSTLGLKFWHEANKEDAGGQRDLFE